MVNHKIDQLKIDQEFLKAEAESPYCSEFLSKQNIY
jgi:hypothetical protein